MNKKGNAIAILFVLVLIAIIFISWYAMLRPTALVEHYLTKNDFENRTQAECEGSGYWENGVCQELPARARSLVITARKRWLAAPILLVVTLLIWAIMVSLRRDARTERIVTRRAGRRIIRR